MYRALIAIMAFALVSCVGTDGSQTNVPRRLTYGLTLQPSGIDPHVFASAELGIPLRQVYDTLVYRDPKSGEFTPGLAERWAISQDGLTYTFFLKKGVRFHDGTAFDSSAVAANLDRIVDPNTASQRALFMLGPYAGYELQDEYTINVRLTEPYSPLLDSLSQVYLGIASPSAIQKYSVDQYQFHQVGTGPFRFVEYVPGERIVLQRSAEYAWGPTFYEPPTGDSVEEVAFRFFTDAPTRANAVLGGLADVVGEIPPLDARTLSTNNKIRIIQVPIPGQPLQFLINTRRTPTDSSVLRQALILAADRNSIADAVFQRFSPAAWGPLASTTMFFNSTLVGRYNHDPDQAQSLLDSLGLADQDQNGYLDSASGSDLEIKVITPPWGQIPEVAQLLQDQWRSIGIRAKLESVPTIGALRDEVEHGDYNLVAYYQFGLDPVFFDQFFSTNGTINWAGVANSDLDTLLSEGTRQPDLATRRDLYLRAQALIMDEALILPIRDYVNLIAVDRSVQNLTFDAYGWFPILNNVHLQNLE